MSLWRKKHSLMEARPMPVVFHLETERGRERGMPGDYLCQDATGAQWIMDEGTLRAGYEPALPDGREAAPPPTAVLCLFVYRDLLGQLAVQISLPPGLGEETRATWEEAICLGEERLRRTRRALHRGRPPGEEADGPLPGAPGEG